MAKIHTSEACEYISGHNMDGGSHIRPDPLEFARHCRSTERCAQGEALRRQGTTAGTVNVLCHSSWTAGLFKGDHRVRKICCM